MGIRAPSILFAAAFSALRALGDSGPNLPLDHPYTLRNAVPALLENEYHRMATGEGERSYIFPRACASELDSSDVCEERSRLGYLDPIRKRSLYIVPIAGFEHRYLGENVEAFEGGLTASGGTGPISFHLDVRMYTELHEQSDHVSFDREFLETQDEEASGSVAYSSFSRFRSNFSYDWEWGRLTVSRDAVHWGPGLFHNLAFNQEAIPFNQAALVSRIGPISVITLYGRLAMDRNWQDDTTTGGRSLYAHRYEWRAARNLLLGLSEQLILHDAEAPFAFVPIVPLFIAKAYEKEARNNGNIAVDATWHAPGLGRIYSEFFIDDLQSPTSLFDDFWGNKWAWMAGAHWTGEFGGWRPGAIAEYSRVEPWVYTHYESQTAQTANFDYPLGDPSGPNSQTVTVKAYARNSSGWYLSAKWDVLWKGTDPGSSIVDVNPKRLPLRKKFLGGSDGPGYRVSPWASYLWNGITLGVWAEAGDNFRAGAFTQYRY